MDTEYRHPSSQRVAVSLPQCPGPTLLLGVDHLNFGRAYVDEALLTFSALNLGDQPVSYTHLTLPTIYSV